MTDTLTIPQLKQLIWQEADQNLQYINTAKTNINWDHTQTDHAPYMWYKLLVEVKRLRSTRLVTPAVVPMRRQYPAKYRAERPEFERLPEYAQPVPDNIPDDQVKSRYYDLHRAYFKTQYPAAYNDGHYTPALWPKIGTANGLTTYILNYLLWSGWRATRINVSGRLIDKIEGQPSGAKITVKKMIKSSTRKGSADISSTIQGRSVQWEIKIGRDIPSHDQLREQAREIKAGGMYLFIKTANEFLGHLDIILHG